MECKPVINLQKKNLKKSLNHSILATIEANNYDSEVVILSKETTTETTRKINNSHQASIRSKRRLVAVKTFDHIKL